MTMFLAPYTAIADIDGSPLDAGFLFFGEYGKDPELFPVEVFWDADFTVPAAQPIRTRNGYPVRNGSPTKVYIKATQHSIVIKNRNGAFILVDFKNKGRDESAAYFYNTTLEMIADNSLSSGVIVGTKGYRNTSDKGGATYIISTTPTSYSIPLSNGLHAVFSDVFDVRKFGLQDDPTFTIDQTEEIRRMINYADARFYEIDFHGFRIKTPEIVSHTSSRAVTYRGMPFHKVHTLKNLELRHNRGADLIPEGLVCIGFYPKSANDVSGLFRLSNVKFDPILQNYSTVNGESDGAFIGFHAEPHPDWGYSTWNVVDLQEFPIDFDFQDIDFKSPAMSYNISVSGWKSRKITWNNLVGDYLGLYIFSCASKVVGGSVDAIYRKDLHTQGRGLVRSAVHIEPETGPDGSVKFDLIDIENVKVRDSDGNIGLGFFSYVNGKLEIKELKLKNIDGYSEVYVNYAKGGYVNNLTLENTKGYALNGTFDEINVKDSITSVQSKSNIGNNGVLTTHPLGNVAVTNLNFKGGAIVGKLTDGSAYTVVRNISIDGTPISTQEYLLDTPDIDTYRITAKSVDFKDSSKFIRSKFGRIDLQNVTLNSGYPISDFISRGDNGGVVFAVDSSLNPQLGNLVSSSGITVAFKNVTSAKTLESLIPSSPYVESRLSSFAAIQIPSGSSGSIANDAVFTVSASVQYCNIGDTFDVSTNLPFPGCLVFAKCETNGTITVRVKNFSGSTVGLEGVVFNVHRLTIN
ncbi:hypothetical protein [Acinetobacter lwoffii]|uniref:hypothetical protein n=1 Tax=Acinetobacter lwoffii TaxID=28090 RepID=UPI002DBC3586|nr:hypothetical protein [Acinetobacter lwoffii]MEB6681041.1 hypothetical protein [Acinetobacter lwoffii]